MLNCNKKLHVCVVTDICRNMHVKCTTKWTMTLQIFFVSQCLQHVSNSVHDEQYICSSCSKILTETSDENPIVPHHAKYPNVVTGANFLKTLKQRPEYACTCCHCMFFIKLCNSFTWKTMI